MLLKIILAMGLTLNMPFKAHTEYVSLSPKIEKFYTSIPEKENWVIVPKGTKEITIYVEAQNTESVLFWLIPTGTQQWYERILIGYNIKVKLENTPIFTLSFASTSIW